MASREPHNHSNGNGSHDSDVRERIAECALDLFATRGYAATSVREIVEAVGVTKPTLYYYFESKEHLYTTLLAERLTQFDERVRRQADETGPFEERLERMVWLYFEALDEMPHIARLFLRSMLSNSPHLPPFDPHPYNQSIQAALFDIFRDAVEAGEMPRSLLRPFIAVEFLGLVTVFVLRHAIGYADDLTREKARLVVHLFLNGMRGLAENEEPSLLETLKKEGFDSV